MVQRHHIHDPKYGHISCISLFLIFDFLYAMCLFLLHLWKYLYILSLFWLYCSIKSNVLDEILSTSFVKDICNELYNSITKNVYYTINDYILFCRFQYIVCVYVLNVN